MTPPSLRPDNTTPSGAPVRSRLPAWLSLAAALLAAALVLVTQLTGSRSIQGDRAAVPGFLADALGEPAASSPLVRRPAPGVEVSIERGGYRVKREAHALVLQAATEGGPWKRFDRGATRTTPFGAETVTVKYGRTEQFLTVRERQGKRTWRWHLDTGTLEPKLRVGGRIDLLDGRDNSGLAIAPAAILDTRGRFVTPAGTRWRLERHGKGWTLALDLDDRKLPLPYVIDPAANYPATLELRSTPSSIAGSWTMDAGTGAANTLTSNEPARNATGYYQWNPGVANTALGTPGAATGRGWLIDPIGGATGFPAGTWSFTVRTDIAGTTLIAGTANLAVGLWHSPLAGPAVPVLPVTDDPLAQNLRTQLTPKTTTVSFNLPKFSLASNETLYVELWRRQTVGINSTNAANRRLTLEVNSGISQITHPAADDTAPTPALSITAPSGAYLTGTTLYYRGAAAGSFAFRNAITDGSGSGAFQSVYPAIATAGWTHSAENVTTGPNFQSSTYSWTPSPSSPVGHTVTSEDNALQTATTGVTFVDDSTVPNNDGSLSVGGLVGTGSLYSTSTDLALTFAKGTDAGGSGIAATGHLLQRAETTLSSSDGKVNGTCGSFGLFSTIATDPVSPYTDNAAGGVATGKCYRYQYVVTDNVGNTRTYTSVDVKVDTSGPAAPTLTLAEVTGTAWQHVSGTEIFYNPSGSNAGSFTVDSTDATTNDGQSGIASVSFPALPAGFTGGGADTTPTPYRGTYSWDNTAATSPGARIVTVANNATGTGTQTFTVTKDTSAPTGHSVALSGGPWYTTASVPLTPTDGSDNVGGAGIDTASRVYEREEATLAGGVCGSWGGSWTVVSNPDATVQSGKCYRYRLTISDNVGNASAPSAVSAAAQVDTSGPGVPGLSYGGFTNASATGSTVYVRSGAAGAFTVSGTSTDTESGIGSLTFPTFGAGWGGGGPDGSSPYQGVYAFAAGATIPSGNQDVTATNGAGTVSAAAPFTVVADATAPSSSAQCDGGSCAPWFTTSPVSVVLSASDGGSGVAEIRYTLDGSDPSPVSPLYSIPLSIAATTTVKFRGYDNVGNEEAVSSVLVQVDTSQPSAPSLSLSETDPDSHVTGTTLYYNPSGSNAGSFTVDGSSADGQSGIDRLGFPTLAGATGGGDDLSSPYASTYDWTSATTATGTQTVTARNGAGLTQTADFTVAQDTAAPTGHSVAVSGGAGWVTGGSVALVPTDGADGGAGLDTASRVYEREDAPLTAGSCGAWSGSWTAVANPDNTIASGFCYRYRLKISDNVGNQSAGSAPTGAVKVDTSAPADPTLSFGAFTNASATGSTVYIRPGVAGGLTVSGAVADAQSGIASVAFPALGANWTGGGADASAPYEGVYTFTAAASAPSGNQDVTATNGAGTTSGASAFTVVEDSAAPVTSADCNAGSCAPWFASTPVSVTLAGADGGSGIAEIRYTLDGSDPDGTSTLYSGAIPVSATTTIKFRAYDRVGNVEAVRTRIVQVDTTAPAAPTLSFDGFTNASATGTTVYVRPGVAGGFTVHGPSTDGESGIASVTFPALGANWTGGGADAGPPYESAYTFTAAASAPSGNQDVVALNGAGTASAAAPFTLVADSTAPTSSAQCDGGSCAPWFTSTPVSVALSANDGGSGLAEIRYTLDGSDPSPVSPLYTTPLSIAATTTVKYRAYDNVGNEEPVATTLVKIDTTIPSAPSLSFGSFTNASATGATVYVRPGAAGGFTVTGTSDDPESSVASMTFPAFGAGWSGGGADGSSPYEGVYSFGAAATPPSGNQDVTAANGSGSSSEPTPFTVVADTTAPTSSAQCEGGSCAPWFTTSPVSVALSATDGGSGLAEIRYTLDSSDPSPLSSLYSTPLSIAATGTVKFRAYDKVGNEEAVASVLVKIDTTQPSAPSLTLDETDVESHVSGTTLYYNPSGSNSGSFTVSATSTDAESAVDRISFPALAGAAGGGDDTSSPYSATYDWTAATSASGAQTVTVRNGAALEDTTDFTVTQDTTAPSGHSLTVSGGAGWFTGGSVTLVPDDGTDGGAGIAASSRVYERDEAPLTDGSCGAWAGTWTTVSNPDITVGSGFCYRYRLRVSDNVGNQSAASAATGTVKVDTSAPAAPSLTYGSFTASSENGGTVWYRPSAAGGSFVVTASGVDPQSGVASYAFPAPATGWFVSGSGDNRTYAHAGSPTDPADPNDVTVTNNAGLTSPAAGFTVSPDGSAPTGMSATVTAGYAAGLSVPVTLDNGSDAASGVDPATRVVERDDALLDNGDGSCDAFPGSWSAVTLSGGADTGVVSGRCYRYRLRISDRVGNEAISGPSATVKVDASDPTGSVTAPAAGANVRGSSVAVTSDSADTGSGAASARFERSPAGAGTWTEVATDADGAPWSVTWDTTAVADGLYDLRVITTDGVGRTATSAAVASIRVDNSDPASTVAFPADATSYNGAGWSAGCATAGLCGTASDGGSGLQRVEFSLRRGSGNYWDGTSFGSASEVFLTATGTAAWSYGFAGSSFPADGAYSVRVRAVDVAGNVESASSRTFTVDTAAPATTVDSQPADPTSATGATFTFSSSETGSTFECKLDVGSFVACSTPRSYSSLSDGSHTFEVRATDAAGNTDATPASFTWLVDTTAPSAPTLSFGSFTNAAAAAGEVFYRPSAGTGEFAVTATSTDAQSGVSGYAFPALAGWSRSVAGDTATYSHSGSPSDPAEPNDVTATSGSGVVSAATSFTVTPDAAGPTGMSATVTGGYVTALSVAVTLDNGSDAASGVDPATRVVERDEAPLDNGDGSCDAFPGTWSTVTLSGGADTTVATGSCYRYRLRISDRVGNQAVSGPSATVKVDTSAPAAPALGFSALTNASASGSTLWFRPGGGGGFTLTPTGADAQSGIASSSHPNLGSGWSRTGNDYSFTAAAADPVEPNNVTVTNGAGLTSPAAPFTVSPDSAAPTGGSVTYADGYDADGTVTVTTDNGTDGDSGVAAGTAVLERQTASLASDACGSFGAWSAVTSPDTVASGTCARYRLRVSDRVGNEATFTSANVVKVDLSAPSAPTLTPTEGSAWSHVSGTTVYLNAQGAYAGLFSVGAASTDVESGIAKVNFPALGGAAGGGDDTSSPFSATYGWDASTTASGAQTAIAHNVSGLTSSAPFDVVLDTAAPTGGSVTYPDGYDADGTVTVTTDNGTDGASGLAAGTAVLERQTASLNGGVCGSFGGWSAVTSPDTVATGTCARYRLRVSDRVGNEATFTSANVVTVDTDPATVSLDDPGANLRGSVALTATASDGGSGVSSVEFQRSLAGLDSWTTVGTDATAPYSDSFDTSAVADGLVDLRAIATDAAGNPTTSAIVSNRRVDNTAPAATMDDPGANVRATVTLTATASDAGSGVASLAFEHRPAGGGSWTATPAAWNTSALADGLYDVRVTVTDAAGNETTSAPVTDRRVDNTPPAVTMDDPGADLSGTVSLSASSSDGGSGIASVAFQYKLAADSTWTATAAAWNTTPLGDGLYDLRAIATDNAGNATTSAPVTNRRVDNGAPSVTITAPGTHVNGAAADPFAVTATSPDSDLAQVEFFRCDNPSASCSTGSWTSLGVDTSAPFSGSWPVDADGNRALRAIARDVAGNTGSNVANTLVDRTAPSGGSVTYADGHDADGTVAISAANGTDGGSGVDADSATIERQTAALASGVCGAYGPWNAVTSPDTVGSGDCARYRLRVADFAGNVATYGSANAVMVDTTAPAAPPLTLSESEPDEHAAGTTLYYNGQGTFSGTFTVEAAATDAQSGIASVSFPLVFGDSQVDVAAPYSLAYDWTGTDTTEGSFTVTATNGAGLTSGADFTLVRDVAPPSGGSVAYVDGYRTSEEVALTLVDGNDAASGVDGASGLLRRASAPLAGGVCGSFGGAAAIAADPAAGYTDLTVASGNCYRYEYAVTDNVGNEVAYASSAVAKVDAEAPTGAVDDPGPNLRGTVSLTATAADTGGAGVDSVEFRRSPAGGGPWTTIATDPSAPYSAGFDTTTVADGLYDLQVVVTDGAGAAIASAPVSARRVDNTPPAVSLSGPGAHVRATVNLSATASDAGSGLAGTVFEVAPAGTGAWSPTPAAWDTTALADGFYDVRAVATDNAGNQAISTVLGREVDNTPPGTTIETKPASFDNDDTPTFTFSSNESPDATFECRVDGGAWSACSSPNTLASLGDGAHTLDARSLDLAGNVDASPDSWTWTIDATDPSVSLTYPSTGALLAGVVTLTASATDASGAPTVIFEVSGAGLGDWTTVSSSWDTATVEDGRYDVRATATDAAGNTASATATDVLVDNTAPTVNVTSPAGAYVNATAPTPFGLGATATDDGAGVVSVEFLQRLDETFPCASPSSSWSSIGLDPTGPFGADWTLPADGEYVLCALARDAAGHTRTANATVTVDRTDPVPAIDAVAPYVRGTISLGSPSTDATSGVGQVDFQQTASGSSSWQLVGADTDAPFGASFDTTAVPDGDYDLRAFVTDRAGNPAASAPVTTRVDNTPPTGNVTGPATGSNLRLTVPVTSDSADGGSGVQSGQLQTSPAGTETWTNLGAADTDAPYGVDWDTTAYADGLYDLRVITTDRAGNTFTSAALASVRVDNTKPAAGIADPGAYLRGSVSLTGTATDEGSGVATVEFQRSPAGLDSWTSVATDADEPYGAGLDTGALADALYDLRVLVTDRAGNQETAQIANRRVDNTKPAASLTDPGVALNSGVTLSAAASDDGSGVASVEFQRAAAGSGSWATLANDTSDPYTAAFDTTAVPDGLYDLRVVVTDNAGNQETSGVGGRRVDNTAPTTSASGVPSGPTPGPITITLAASDGGVGVAETKYRIDGGALQGYSGGITIGGADGAYTIQYFSVDALGNVEATHTVEVVIDNTGPGAGPGDPGRYLRGIVTLTAAPTDDSGIASVEFQFSPAGAGAWASIATVLGAGPYETTWNSVAVTDGPYDLQVVVTDMAGNVTTESLPDLPKIVDNTSPTGSVTSPAEGALRSGTFTITATAADEPADGSVSAVEFQVRPGGGSWTTVATDTAAPYAATWNSAGSPDGAAELRVVVSDSAGNDPTISAVRTITLDNNAPTVNLSAPSAGGGTIALSASGSGDIDRVTFERSSGGGAWSAISTDSTPADGFNASFATTSLADGTYELRARATDVSGNEGTSGGHTISVDNTNPTATVTAPTAGAEVGGPSVTLSANASDGTSGVGSVTFQIRPAGGGGWADVAVASGAPWSASWNATSVADGQYELRARIADFADNTGYSAPISITVDSTAPTVTLGPVAGTLSGTVTLTATTTGSGATSVTFERRPSGGSWAAIGSDSSEPWSLSFNTSSVADGVYDLRAVVRDEVGNSNESVRTDVRIDNSAPTLVSSKPQDGETLDAVDKIELTASEPLAGVDATVDGKAVTVTVNAASAAISGTLGPGAHVVSGELRDAAGKSSDFRVSFTVRAEDGEASGEGAVEGNFQPGAGGSVISVDGGLTVIIPAGAVAGAEGWTIFKINTGAPRGDVGGGFAANGPVWDITARTPSGKTFHSFAKPVELVFSEDSLGIVPATFEEGRWRPLPRLVTPGTLPADQSDGFWRDGETFHVLTRHLSLWAILSDNEAPQPPQDLSGTVGADGLTLHWRPGPDNSGLVDEVTLFVNGERYASYSADVTEAKLGAFRADDPRTFTWRERDAAGNVSVETPRLRTLPPLAGKTLAEAQSALGGRGFRVGTVTERVSSAPPGTVIEPAGIALAVEGSAVPLVVAAGATPGQARLVFSVAGPKQLDRTKRSYVGVRIKTTRRVTARATLVRAGGRRLYTWRLNVRPGASIVKLRLPRTVTRPGRYRIAFVASAAGQTARRTAAVDFIKPGPAPATRGRVGVVLTGLPAARAGVVKPLGAGKTRAMKAGVDAAFDTTANRAHNVGVVVVDVDRFGLQLVRDLRTVFPMVRIVALSDKPRLLVRAIKAGATIALPRSTPDAQLVSIVRRLATRR
jgi:hypothetical protein